MVPIDRPRWRGPARQPHSVTGEELLDRLGAQRRRRGGIPGGRRLRMDMLAGASGDEREDKRQECHDRRIEP